MAFLCNVVEDPQILSRILNERESKKFVDNKKRRLISPVAKAAVTAATTSTSSESSGMAVANSVKMEFEEDEVTVGNNMMSSSPELGFEIDYLHRAPPQEVAPVGGWWGQMDFGQMGYRRDCEVPRMPVLSPAPAPMMWGENRSDSSKKGGVGNFNEMAAENSKLPPYPFSLLEGGF